LLQQLAASITEYSWYTTVAVNHVTWPGAVYLLHHARESKNNQHLHAPPIFLQSFCTGVAIK